MGDLLRPVRALLALVPLSATGCGAIAGAGALGMCGGSGDHTLRIVSPDHGAAFDGEPFDVRFRLEDNDYEVEVIAFVEGGVESGRVRIPPEQREGTITVFPPVDSGTLRLELESSSSSGTDQGWSHDERSIQWTAPWIIDRVDRCDGQGCALDDGRSMTGRVVVGPVVLRDATRLVRAEVRLGEVVLGEAAASPFLARVDLDPIADGARTLTIRAVRDDGRVASADRTIEVANCARVAASPHGAVVYGQGGERFEATTGTVDLVDLARDTTESWTIGGPFGRGGPLAHDDAGTLYAGYSEGDEVVYRIDVGSPAPPARAATLPVTVGISSIAIAGDGSAYVTIGRPIGTYKRLLRVADGAAAEVSTSPLAADVVLVDDDGTLLVGAGPELWRLTVSEGVETARALLLTRPGGHIVHLARDDLGRTYVVDALLGQVARYAAFDAAPEVLHTTDAWSLTVYPPFVSFLEYPVHCHGLSVGGVVVEVGEVRGRP